MTLREIEWESPLLEPRPDPDLEKSIRAETASFPPASVYFTPVPWVARAGAVLNKRILTRTRIDHDLADLIGLVVSQDASCRYCFAATRALLLGLGYSARRVAELEQGLITTDFSPRERAALELARRLSHASPRPTSNDLDPLRRAGFDELAIKEIVATTVLNVLFNRMSTISALPPEPMEQLPDRWYMKLISPLMRPALRRMERREAPRPLCEEERHGPYAATVIQLDGLPVAGELRTAIDAMWESPVLPRRSKALGIAIIARALGDQTSERESIELAIAAGFPAGEIEGALAHLSSAQFDEAEAAIVPFARETIWYEAPALQRRARALRQSLGPERFIELIAVVALANALCRVAAVYLSR